MGKNKHKESWKEIFVAIVILLIFIIVLNNNGERISSKEELRTISISGMDETITINNIEPSKIYISGMGAVVYFSESSNPKEIYLSGMNSIAYLCEGIHNPIIKVSGMNAKSVYRTC